MNAVAGRFFRGKKDGIELWPLETEYWRYSMKAKKLQCGKLKFFMFDVPLRRLMYNKVSGEWDTPTAPAQSIVDKTITARDAERFEYWAKANLNSNDYTADYPAHVVNLR